MTKVQLVKAELKPGENGINVVEFTYQAEAFGAYGQIVIRENTKSDDIVAAENGARQKLNSFFTNYTPRV